MEKICKDIIDWLIDRVNDAKAKGLILGVSGGIDSAVLAALVKRAFPDDSLGIIMPCHSNPIDEEHGLLLANTIDLKLIKVDLTSTYDELLKQVDLNNKNDLALANIKPRLRMTTLYYNAQLNSYLVAGATNKSEMTVGYFTKHGDSGVDLMPLASFTKTEIKQMARFLNIPEIIINKPPTAGLWEDQTDEKEMGFSYNILDNYIENKIAPEDIANKIENMDKKSQHKKEYPQIYQVKLK